MKGRPLIEDVELFGTTQKIVFDPDRKEFRCIGRVDPRDVARLIDKIAEHYQPAKSKRGKRIAEIASELAFLVKEDCDFSAHTNSYVAKGFSLLLEQERKVIEIKTEY